MRFKTTLAILLLIPVFAMPSVSSAYSNSSSSNTNDDTTLLKQLIALVQSLQQQLNELLEQQSSDSSSTNLYNGPLTIDYPNGGQIFSEGEEVGIGWHPNGPLTSTDITKVELISTQGEKDFVLCYDAKEECEDEDGIVYLEMPRPRDDDGGGKYKIKITGEDGQTDMSDKSFTLYAKG